MKPDKQQLVLLKIEDKKYEDVVTYIYAASDRAAAHKSIQSNAWTG